jgi:predicted aconitase with swiveling domain
LTKDSGAFRKGRPLVAGRASGVALVLRRPLSIAGGISLDTGRIIDVHAPQHGELVTGRVLVMPTGRGSSSSSTILAEAIRRGTGPSAIVLAATDQILVMGSLVARMLYGLVCPILMTEGGDYQAISSGDMIDIRVDGSFSVEPVPRLRRPATAT